jgi:hypothetical protein
MKRRSLATQRPGSDSLPKDLTSASTPNGDATEKKWQLDEPSGVPAPVIRANMISLRKSFQGRVKVTFFEQD